MRGRSLNIPNEVRWWTCDEVAECLPYQRFMDDASGVDLYRKLWGFISTSKKRVPLGGDGSLTEDGWPTVETPEIQRDFRYGSDMVVEGFWKYLTRDEQRAIQQAVNAEFHRAGMVSVRFWKRRQATEPPDRYIIHHADCYGRSISVLSGGDIYRTQHAGEITTEGSTYLVTLVDGTTFKKERLIEVRAELDRLGNQQ